MELHRHQTCEATSACALRFDDLDTALLRDRSRVDKGHSRRQDWAKQTDQNGADEHVVCVTRELAVVSHADTLNPFVGQLREETPETLRQDDVRLQTAKLVG